MSPIVKISLVVVLFGLVVWYFWPTDANEKTIADLPKTDLKEGEIKIIAFGDSLTAGYGLPISESYPAQLEERLKAEGYEVQVINAGVSGETTKGNLERAEFIRKQNPEIVLLGIGGNDALRSLPLTETKENIKNTISTLKAGENPPVVILLKMQAPLNSGLAYKQDFDQIYEDLALEMGVILVPFLSAEIFLNPENKLPDGIHLNKLGNQKVVEEYLFPVLREVLDK